MFSLYYLYVTLTYLMVFGKSMAYIDSLSDLFVGFALDIFSVSDIDCTCQCVHIYSAVNIQLAIKMVYIWYVKKQDYR